MYSEFRISNSYSNTSKDTYPSNQSGKGKSVLPAVWKGSSPSTLSESEDGHTSLENFSEASATSPVSFEEEQKSIIFSSQDIQQTESASLSRRMLSAGYRNGNRGAVGVGLAGALVGGVVGGSQGAAMGMTVGSSIGTHMGVLSGAIQEYSSPSPVAETGNAAAEQSFHDVPEGNHFSGHVIQVVDHAGHHAAMGSIAVGVAAFLASLATGNPMPVALHVAGIYSGAAWAFGLTTGTAKWLQQHAQRSVETLQREQKSSPGDIELPAWKVVETPGDKRIETENKVITK